MPGLCPILGNTCPHTDGPRPTFSDHFRPVERSLWIRIDRDPTDSGSCEMYDWDETHAWRRIRILAIRDVADGGGMQDGGRMGGGIRGGR